MVPAFGYLWSIHKCTPYNSLGTKWAVGTNLRFVHWESTARVSTHCTQVLLWGVPKGSAGGCLELGNSDLLVLEVGPEDVYNLVCNNFKPHTPLFCILPCSLELKYSFTLTVSWI